MYHIIKNNIEAIIDDSDENLERIHLMGMEWWSEFGEKTLKFIENE